MKRILTILSIVVATKGIGEVVTQTQWFEGPDFQGPTESWDAGFHSCNNINYCYDSDRLSLVPSTQPPVSNHIGEMSADWDKKIEAADIDNDGDMDIIVGGNARVLWLKNSGTGSFSNETNIYSSTSDYIGYALADFNNDGAADIVIGDTELNTVKLLMNNGEGVFSASYEVGKQSGVNQVAAVDLDNDGDIDIVSTKHHQFTALFGAYWFENTGNNKDFSCHQIGEAGNGSAKRLNTADLDYDGDIDFTVSAQHGTLWFENRIDEDGVDPGFVSHVLTSTVENIYDWLGDVDNDGIPDIITVDLYATYPTWWENRLGGNFAGFPLPSGNYNPEGVVSIDFDYDGDIDIAQAFWNAGSQGKIGWYENNGNQVFSYHDLDDYPYACDLIASDLNGNGFLDLVASTHNPGYSIDWWDCIDAFVEQGELISSILDAGSAADWLNLNWDAKTTDKTSIQFQVRTGNSVEGLPDWSMCPVLDSPGSIETTVTQSTRYFQYKAIFSTTDPDYSPLLYEISVEFNDVGICENSISPVLFLQTSGKRIKYQLPQGQTGNIHIYDVSGSNVKTMEITGNGEVEVCSLPAGLYFVRLNCENQNVTDKMIMTN